MRHVILPFLREHLDPHITEHLCKSAAILRGDLGGPRPVAAETGGSRSRATATGGPRYLLTIAPATGYTPRAESVGALPAACELSRAALAGRTLEVRPWRAGDRIAPTGLGGHSRKLQDVFVTAKVPPSVRATLPILCDVATGEVLWVPGYRIAQSVAVESRSSPSWRFTLRG